jgi:hypothetical protein
MSLSLKLVTRAWASADFFSRGVGDGGKNTFCIKTTEKIQLFSKKSKNILFLASLGRQGEGISPLVPTPLLWTPMDWDDRFEMFFGGKNILTSFY